MPESTQNDPLYVDVYEGRCNSEGPPKEGFYRIVIPRKKRRSHLRQYQAARLFRPVPLDPDTGEVIDRYPAIVGEIEGHPADYRKVWADGEQITEDEYKWLRALNAIRL